VLTLIGLGLFGLLALVGGGLAVTLRDPVYAVLALVKAMVGLAGIYFLLGAEYIGAMQVIVYAGAILVTFLFVVMLINLSPADIPPLPRGLALYGSIGIALGWMLLLGYALTALMTLPSAQEARPEQDTSLPYLFGTLPPIGKTLFTAYAFPFEVLSITLLVGLIGASLLVQKRHTHES
jgi:NADH-quinone oxidoreductase subunit J